MKNNDSEDYNFDISIDTMDDEIQTVDLTSSSYCSTINLSSNIITTVDYTFPSPLVIGEPDAFSEIAPIVWRDTNLYREDLDLLQAIKKEIDNPNIDYHWNEIKLYLKLKNG